MPHPFLEVPAQVKVIRDGHPQNLGIRYIKLNIFDIAEIAPSGDETCLVQYSSGREREVVSDYRKLTAAIEEAYEDNATIVFEPGEGGEDEEDAA